MKTVCYSANSPVTAYDHGTHISYFSYLLACLRHAHPRSEICGAVRDASEASQHPHLRGDALQIP